MSGLQVVAQPFVVHICAEVESGEKRNVEVKFERKPDSVATIGDEAENIFRNEIALRGGDPRSFSVDFMVYFDDHGHRWKPLERIDGLEEYMQIYLFQSNTGSAETIKEIPPPSSQATAFASSGRKIHRPGQTSIDEEKTTLVFKQMDLNDSESVEVGEMVWAFNAAGVDFNEETIGRLFEKSDANNDGEITWEEFCIFAELFPNTVETLYWRLRHLETAGDETAAGALRRHRQKENLLRKEVQTMERDRKVLESRVRQEQAIARELDPRRRFLEDEEQDLINKEFALQFHRDMVVQAEANFAETASRFDHASMKQGSPRRARYLN